MLISRKRNPVLHPPLFMNSTMINNTSFHKHLGLTFSNTGSSDEHVKSISEQSWSRLHLLKALKFRVFRKSLEKIILHIYVLFWNIAILFGTIALLNKKKTQLLDAVHVEAARIVTGATKLCSIDKLFIELGWESLQTRRNKHKLATFYKLCMV